MCMLYISRGAYKGNIYRWLMYIFYDDNIHTVTG